MNTNRQKDLIKIVDLCITLVALSVLLLVFASDKKKRGQYDDLHCYGIILSHE